jgi:hypothetical protein
MNVNNLQETNQLQQAPTTQHTKLEQLKPNANSKELCSKRKLADEWISIRNSLELLLVSERSEHFASTGNVTEPCCSIITQLDVTCRLWCHGTRLSTKLCTGM